MDIIEFIQNNFLVVLGVLFFLFKMFAGSKKPTNTSAPTFGGDSREVSRDNNDDADETYEEHPSLEQQRREREEQEKERRYEENRRRQLDAAMRVEQQQQKLQAEAMRQRVYEQSRSNGNAQSNNHDLSVGDAYNKPTQVKERHVLSSDELRRAVVWSEILGQPRARRPFRK